MKTNATPEILQYSSPVCETLACETMMPLCVSTGIVEAFKEEDYVWQVK